MGKVVAIYWPPGNELIQRVWQDHLPDLSLQTKGDCTGVWSGVGWDVSWLRDVLIGLPLELQQFVQLDYQGISGTFYQLPLPVFLIVTSGGSQLPPEP